MFCVYILGLVKLREAGLLERDRPVNEQCQSLGFVIVMPREAGPVVVDW